MGEPKRTPPLLWRSESIYEARPTLKRLQQTFNLQLATITIRKQQNKQYSPLLVGRDLLAAVHRQAHHSQCAIILELLDGAVTVRMVIGKGKLPLSSFINTWIEGASTSGK